MSEEPKARIQPTIRQRIMDATVYREARGAGYTKLQATVLAGRLVDGTDISRQVKPVAADFDAPDALPDIDIASSLLADAISQRRPIALVTDHDADGATSNAILRFALQGMGYPIEAISSYLSHRLTEGYGVSDRLVERLLPELKPNTYIVTADQGSCDEPRIAQLRAAGHTIIVTDHHGVPDEGPPVSAHAVVNPVRQDSQFLDKAIAGCHTALLVMAGTRSELIKRGVLSESSPRISRLLDICAVGTIADAVTMAHSRNNRLVVQRGLDLMNTNERPPWQALRRLLKKEGPWTAEDIAFQIAPRINARGRLSDAMLGVEFLCADSVDVAYKLALQLDADNRQRRDIEKALTERAIQLAEKAIGNGRIGLCLWMGEDAHPGVHGITATRIVERFGRPTICLSPVQGDPATLTGSIRTTDEVHVKNTLSRIQSEWPGLLIAAGGHGGAGGLKIGRSDMKVLVEAWDTCVRDCYGHSSPVPYLWTDGVMDSALDLSLLDELLALCPYGRQFEKPVFTGTFRVLEIHPVGDGTHLRLKLTSQDRSIVDGIWFGAVPKGTPIPVNADEECSFAFTLEDNSFRGTRKLQLQIRAICERPATVTVDKRRVLA